MLNMLEKYMRETIIRGLPITLLSAIGLNKEQLAKIRDARGPEDLENIILVDNFEEINRLIHRVPASEIPTGVLQAMSYFKDQKNAATGIQDAKRGQALEGERTAFEYRDLVASGGIQSKHIKNSFAKLLKTIFAKGKLIGSMWESVDRILYADGIVFDTKYHDLRSVLAYPCKFTVKESSLQYMSEEDHRQRRMQEFQLVDNLAIQLGVADPYKVLSDVYRDIGVDPNKRLIEPAMYQERQMMQEMQQQMLQGGEPQEQGEQNLER
jgi:hypothetical protein